MIESAEVPEKFCVFIGRSEDILSGVNDPFLERTNLLNLGEDVRVKGTPSASSSIESVTRIAIRVSNAENLLKSSFVVIVEPEERSVSRNALSARIEARVMSLPDAAFKFSCADNVQVAKMRVNEDMSDFLFGELTAQIADMEMWRVSDEELF